MNTERGVTRAPTAEVLARPVAQVAPLPTDVRVRNVIVRVPDTLVVSESNSYYPKGDIVWHGDPYGNRYEQVKAVVQDGVERGARQLKGKTRIDLYVDVLRFHAMSERTRYTIGGFHEIELAVTVVNSMTGLRMADPYFVKTTLRGFGGEAAVRAEAMGQTQKVRISDHLAQLIVTEFSPPSVR